MKKKGFTLVELLAVIVILAIIALIAVPMILGVIEKTKKGAAKSSVIGFIDAVEKQIMMNQVDSDLENDILDGTYDVNENGELVITGKTPILVKVKGSIPTGTVKVENSKVVDYTLTVNGYTTTFEGNISEEVVLHTLSGILKDENGSPLTNTVVAVFSELKVTTTNENGKLIVTGLETGNHEVYVMPAGITEEEVLSMTKEEIGEASIAIGTYSTDTKEITFTTGSLTFELENDTPVEEEPTIVEAESVSIINEEETLYVGDTLQLNVTVLPDETTDKSVTWETSDSEVATVDENGLVTGVSAGTVTITVKTSNNKEATKDITVAEEVATVTFKLGDYVRMTPTSTSYETDTSMTNYSESQTINPSELNLWRVIRINSDGTVDMVSQYVSSVYVGFGGQPGYQNFVGYLNTIASQYENKTYTVGSRHMGYDGTQTEYITDTSALTSTTAPQTSKTSSSNVTSASEAKGLGDVGYKTDYDLVYNVLRTRVAYRVGSTSTTGYWLASRYYNYGSSSDWSFHGRYIPPSGSISYRSLYIYYSGFDTGSSMGAVRPIVTLKSGIQATGSGTSADPYVLP